jgi:hypothetical protein
VRLLIDGYNLLFQSPHAGRQRGPSWTSAARQRLIDWLQSNLHQQLLQQTVIVFDASRGSQMLKDYSTSSGLRILFANDYPQADDLLEQLINQHSAPKSLQVVSSDLRIRRRAKARRSTSIEAHRFIEIVDSGALMNGPKVQPHRTDQSPAKPEVVEGHDVQYWLDEFDL